MKAYNLKPRPQRNAAICYTRFNSQAKFILAISIRVEQPPNKLPIRVHTGGKFVAAFPTAKPWTITYATSAGMRVMRWS